MLLPRQRGGKSWFAFEAKSFEIEVEEAKKRAERMYMGEKKGDHFVDQIRGAQLNPSVDGLRRLCEGNQGSSLGKLLGRGGKAIQNGKGLKPSGCFHSMLGKGLWGKKLQSDVSRRKRCSRGLEDLG